MVTKGLREEDRLCTEAFGVGLMATLIERRAKGKALTIYGAAGAP